MKETIKWMVRIVLRLFIVYPLLLLMQSRVIPFADISEWISIIPLFIGSWIRADFYTHALESCGEKVRFNFGVVLNYRNIRIGNNVFIGRYNNLGMVDFGDNILIAQNCHFLSGPQTHDFSDANRLIIEQPSHRRKIFIGNDVWIGANAVIMDSVEDGAVVGALSVVTRPVASYTVVVGNPARVIKRRK